MTCPKTQHGGNDSGIAYYLAMLRKAKSDVLLGNLQHYLFFLATLCLNCCRRSMLVFFV